MNKKFYIASSIIVLIIFLIITGCTGSSVNTHISQPTENNEINIDNATPENNPTLQNQSSSVASENESLPLVQAEIKILDGLGREVSLVKPAERIVTLAPSNTEILFAIGADSQVVGRDTLSDYPDAAKKIDDVGGGYGEFDLEKIVSLNPDLVIASSLNPEELVTKLEGLKITVFYLSNPDDLEGMYKNLLTVAQLTGHTPEAETLVEDLKERVENVIIKTKDIENRPLVFYEIDGTDPAAPWTSGKGTFIDTLVNLAGGRNLGSVMDSKWAQISIEEIIAQDPDIILIGDAVWGGVTVDAVKARSAWDTLSAIKNDRTFEFDDNIVSRPGPRLVEGLEALARLLHPDLF